jgi:hypothetical protein
MNGKQSRRRWHLGLIWLALLLGFYGFGIQVGRVFGAPVYPPCANPCNCVMLNWWSAGPTYTTCVGDFDTSNPLNPVPQQTAIVNCNSPGPCSGGGSTMGAGTMKFQVTNTVLACSPQAFPGQSQQYNTGLGGVNITAGTGVASNLWTCN